MNRDTMPDTWMATDGLMRETPARPPLSGPRVDRTVGIFYFLWMGQHGTEGPFDVSRITKEHPEAWQNKNHPAWGPMHKFHWWGEPLFGYYQSDDPWVLRKHAQMLSDAGIDMVVFDVTNQSTYKKVYMKLCEVWMDVRNKGGRTPQICFLTPFWDPARVVKTLYEDLYQPGLYKDLWFIWDGKPLILAMKAKVDPQYHDFFTFRRPQPSYFEGPVEPDMWGWLEVYPQHEFRNARGELEQMVAGVAQNAVGDRLAALSMKNARTRNWHNGANDTRPDAVNWGLNFAEQSEYVLSKDPRFFFITGWNEWIAMRFDEFAGFREPVMFVDQCDQIASRDIEPMRGGHIDHYYYQMIEYVRRYKGVRSAPPVGPARTLSVTGPFSAWKQIKPVYLDDRGDAINRRHPGYDGVGVLTNNTARNDIIEARVARDRMHLYFYVQCAAPITAPSPTCWMRLYLRTPSWKRAHWEGFDFVVNRSRPNNAGMLVERCRGGWNWSPVGRVQWRMAGREMQLAIPRAMLGMAQGPVHIEFKWADNQQTDGDPLAWYTDGDTAPNGRFRYVYRER